MTCLRIYACAMRSLMEAQCSFCKALEGSKLKLSYFRFCAFFKLLSVRKVDKVDTCLWFGVLANGTSNEKLHLSSVHPGY